MAHVSYVYRIVDNNMIPQHILLLLIIQNTDCLDTKYYCVLTAAILFLSTNIQNLLWTKYIFRYKSAIA